MAPLPEDRRRPPATSRLRQDLRFALSGTRVGMMDGLRSALGQMDDVLADLASFAGARATETQILNDTQVRISRVIRGAVEPVWRAHQEPELLRRWLLGSDGWAMPVCEVPSAVGDPYRYEWAAEDGSGRFGFEGEDEVLASRRTPELVDHQCQAHAEELLVHLLALRDQLIDQDHHRRAQLLSGASRRHERTCALFQAGSPAAQRLVHEDAPWRRRSRGDSR